MNICIVTVYHSMNCGSYLQSYALMETLRQKGHNVTFLETGINKPGIAISKAIIKSLLTFKINRANFFFSKWVGFKKEQKVFRTIKNDNSHIIEFDLIIFGSDEIWNSGRKEFAKNPILWGEGIDSENLIAYAPSINRSTLEQIETLEYPERNLKKFKSIMVRDEHTKDVLSHLTKKDINIVLDPTMLLNSEEYQTVKTKACNDKYVLLYTYGNHLNNDQIKKIKNFAASKQLKLVSSNSWFNWCDINIGATPFEFISLVKNAKYIVTDTFHGTIFSILFSKQFVSFAGDNVKVIELLKALDLNSRIPASNTELESIMDTKIDYDRVNELRDSLRKESLQLLTDALNK
ncbi:polysaccharide pyruvyl transferase family protein [Chengkuizengella sediminis]|uniref:polysaccharide pyruvyl transferase family protein n=1 Tax=Chengkuizengella sediminis TaxID=1885917 RepID=UPI001389CF82|nr:polysaccharide pyruvyl transferase family protein [Chengkuizengella sediminis]NDI34876.1 polysaccharide pyruvyl transferase family protein [Chengkuizengella sediminis]